LADLAQPLTCNNVAETTCGRGESNPHARRHQILSLAWLPLHHSRVTPEHREPGHPVPGAARAGGLGSTAAPRVAWSGRLSAVPRDPRQIQLEIDAARESLAATMDQLVYRSSPQRLKSQGQAALQQFLQTPVGMAAVGAVGLLMTLVVVQKVRHRNG
jgi:hypothetical protein